MDKLNDTERKIVSHILGVVEKNFTEVEQVESYLWQLLDKGTEFELPDKEIDVDAHQMTQIQYAIWAEGYNATGQRSGAIYLGSGTGKNFKEACLHFARMAPDFNKHFDAERMTYWGCKLFDNEADARKSYG